MQNYIGLKQIMAKPMTLGEYNKYRGWELPEEESPHKKGFLVEYKEGGQPNHKDHIGYISWSPAGIFEGSYKPVDGMSFGFAVECMKKGFKVARKGWNGKGMWLMYVPGSPSVRPVAGTPYSKAGITEATDIDPHIDMYTAQGSMQPGWLCSQADVLAEDWCVVYSNYESEGTDPV